MNITVKLSRKVSFTACIAEPRLWRVVLWQKPCGIPWLPSGDTGIKDVNAVFVNGKPLDKSPDLPALRQYREAAGSWCQPSGRPRYLYIRFPMVDGETEKTMSAQDWMFTHKNAGFSFGLTDGRFYFGNNNAAFMPGIISGYTQKTTADNNYATIKFNSQTLKVLLRELHDNPFDYIGQPCNVEDTNGKLLDTMLVKSAARDTDVVTFKLKDPREQYTDKVIDQQFNKNDYTNAEGRSVMDTETAKNYKGDAIGYCVGVPGICIDTRKGWDDETPEKDYRRYRVSYGTIKIDKRILINSTETENENGKISDPIYSGGVEVEGENGWISLPYDGSGLNGTGARYWTEAITESLPDGTTIETGLICVPAATAHGVQSGTDIPDFESDAKPLRVSGVFHYERPRIENCVEIWKYLIDRYSSIPYNDTYYNKKELEETLAGFNGQPVGIYIDKPADFFKVIGQLQNGCTYGWQLCVHHGKITAKIDEPDTASVVSIPIWDIVNFGELVVDANAEQYVSNLIVQYSNNYYENTAAEYKNKEQEIKVLSRMTVSKSKTVATLLKNEADARIRYRAEIASSLGITPKIDGIQLRDFERYRELRQFETITIDFGKLTSKTGWRVTGVQIDYARELVTIDVVAKPETFV